MVWAVSAERRVVSVAITVTVEVLRPFLREVILAVCPTITVAVGTAEGPSLR